jgi:hypothetical protein
MELLDRLMETSFGPLGVAYGMLGGLYFVYGRPTSVKDPECVVWCNEECLYAYKMARIVAPELYAIYSRI